MYDRATQTSITVVSIDTQIRCRGLRRTCSVRSSLDIVCGVARAGDGKY